MLNLDNNRYHHRFPIQGPIEIPVQGAGDGALEGFAVCLPAIHGFLVCFLARVDDFGGDGLLLGAVDESAAQDIRVADETFSFAVGPEDHHDHAGFTHDLAIQKNPLAFAGRSAAVDDDVLDRELVLALASRAVAFEFQDLAVTEKVDLVIRIADALCDIRVRGAQVRFAVFGDDVAGAYEAVHQKDVAAVAVAGHMQCQFLVCLHDSSAQVQGIDHLRDSTLVADNRIAAEDHRVPFLHFDVAVRAETHAGKACSLFTLASRSDDERFAVGNLVHARAHFAYQPAWGFQVAQILGDLGIGLHASAGDKHFAVISLGVLHDLLDAVQKRRECRDDHPAFGIADQVFERRGDFALALAEAGLRGVCRVRDDREHSFFAELRQALEICRRFISRGGKVEFEVARMDDLSVRRMENDRGGIRNTVRDPQILHFHFADAYLLAVGNDVQLRLARQALLIQAFLHEGDGELGAIARRIVQLREQMLHRAAVG